VLASSKVVAFLATGDAARAKAFYGEVLGLRLLSEDGFAVVFDANGTMLRVAIVREVVPAPYTVLGWDVEDIAAIARRLTAAGVDFERFAWLQ
jgi:catechol 2,3-dioxygenase-like lactoylglutathione lyase family enzyme